MNIIDAVKSGKRFRRGHWKKDCWVGLKDSVVEQFSEVEVLADDWEVETETKKVKLYGYIQEYFLWSGKYVKALTWFEDSELHIDSDKYKRVPSEDKVVEYVE